MQTRFSAPVVAAARTDSTPGPRPAKAETTDWLIDIGPILSLDSLPPTNTKRWVIRRKAIVVAAVRAGVLSLEEACRRYNLSLEEFLAWQRLVDSHGLPGLRVTRLQDYRGANASVASDLNAANPATSALQTRTRRLP